MEYERLGDWPSNLVISVWKWSISERLNNSFARIIPNVSVATQQRDVPSPKQIILISALFWAIARVVVISYRTFRDYILSRVQNVSGLTYKSRDQWKVLWGMYSAIYGEVNVSVEKCVEIKGRLCWKGAKLFYFCHFKKLVRPETFGPYCVHERVWLRHP